MPKAFKSFPKTPVPKGFAGWTDMSWHLDSAASCFTKVPTKKHPDAQLVLYVEVESPLFTLYWWKDEYCPDGGGDVLYRGDELAGLKLAVKEAS